MKTRASGHWNAAVCAWAIVGFLSAGCGQNPPPDATSQPSVASDAAALAPATTTGPASQGAQTQPALSKKATTPLAELEPVIAKPTNALGADQLSDRTKEMVEQAESLLASDRPAEALPLLERASGFEPNSPRIHRGLAEAYMGIGNSPKAFDHLRRAVFSQPDSLRTQALLGRLYLLRGQRTEAIEAFRTALLTSDAKPADPLAAEALLQLGNLLSQDGYSQAALDAFVQLGKWTEEHAGAYARQPGLQAIALNPERLLTMQAQLMLRLHRPADALTLLNRSRDFDRTYTPTSRLMIEAYMQMGRYDDARELLLDAAAQDAQQQLAASLAGTLAAALARQDKAVEAGELLAQLAYRSGGAAVGIDQAVQTMLAGAKVNDDLARQLSAKAADGKEGWAKHFVAGLVADAAEQSDLAQSELAEAIAAKPDAQAPYEALASIYIRQHRFEQLAALAQRLGDSPADQQLAAELRARSMLAQAKPADALAQLEKSLQIDRRRMATLLLVSRALAQLDQHEQAQGALLAALNLDPDDPDVYQHLFSLYAAQRKFPEAQAVINQLRQRDPDNTQAQLMQIELLMATGRGAEARQLIASLRKQSPYESRLELLEMQAAIAAHRGLLSRDQFNQYMQQLAVLLRRNSRNVSARSLLAEVMVRSGKTSQAIQAVGELYDLAGKDIQLGRIYAQALLQSGRHAQAVEVLQRIVDEEPDDLWALQRLVDAHAELGQWPQAQASANKAQQALVKMLGQTPANQAPAIRAGAVAIYAKARMYDEAVAYLDKWLDQAPDEQAPRQLLMALLREAKRYDQALERLDKWMDPKPDSEAQAAAYHQSRVLLLVEAGQADQAIKYAQGLLNNNPGSLGLRQVLVYSLGDAGQNDRALELTRKWLEELSAEPQTKPSDLDAALAQASAGWCRQTIVALLLGLDKPRDALKQVDEYLARDAQNASLLSLKSSALDELGRADEAMGVLELAHKLAPEDPSMNNNLGYMYADRGIKLEQAQKMILLALSANPDAPSVQDSLAWVLYKQGLVSESAARFEQILTSDDGPAQSAVIYQHAGDAFWRLGWHERAQSLWTQGLELARKAKDNPAENRRAVKDLQARLDAAKQDTQPPVAPIPEPPAPQPK